MKRWLSSPKVRLGLIVNGLYLISLVTPTAAPHKRPRLFPRPAETYDVQPDDKRPAAAEKKSYVYAPLPPPPKGPVKATTHVAKQFDQLDVYLTSDLMLIDRPDHRLTLSPTFTTRASRPEMPDSVLLRFVSYSSERTLSNTTPFTIIADGEEMIDGRTHFWYNGNAVTPPEGVPFIEGMGVELPYGTFLNIISARQVVIELGADRVELTASQTDALRDMHLRIFQLEQPPPAPKDSRVAGNGGVIIQADPVLVRPEGRR
ncbi:MAG: hypothetical protein JOZ96_17640 [Acidobacteria bacterium]|nr:hypothetical protein [Acidobacteriota bacterium]